MKISLSEIKKLKDFCNNQCSQPDWRQVLDNMTTYERDFEVDGVRFIDEDAILEIMMEEIFSDDYTLGCFNASFIASNSNLNYELVEACQKSEAFEAIGKALNETMCDDGKREFCAEYASAGYGHHFNHYDFSEDSITIGGNTWLVFDNRG